MYYKIVIIGVSFIIFFLSGCSVSHLNDYNSRIEYSTFLEKENLNKIHIGMKRNQIDYIFGKPIISDSFNDAYHYIFYSKNNKKNKILSIFFKKNKVFFLEINQF
ncbi:outer membrane protein assembly factor BamE [Buchnera aphidicola]|uniref:outer membrane protein assembly factor BamE n=1 Tax=Buchnera aphidicola TaxID=9 RepID=UPI003BEEEF8D